MPAGSRAVVSVIGRDQKGVVARISTYLASCDINIEDIEQRVMEGLFIMTMQVDLSELSSALDELALGLRRIGDELGMEVSLRLAHAPRDRKRAAILVTKEPHCLRQLFHDHTTGDIPADFAVVLANHPDLEPIAREHGVPFAWHASKDKEAHFDFLEKQLAEVRPDLVVLARYMQILSPALCERLRGRAINIHHSFLPSFKGSQPYRQAFERGVKLIGATAHYVSEDLDGGPIIEQEVERVDHTLDPDELAAIGRDVECVALARAVRWHCEHRILLNGDKTVVFR